jgi:hypothetical protein
MAWLRGGICSGAVIGSAAQRGQVRAAAEHTRVRTRACARTGDSNSPPAARAAALPCGGGVLLSISHGVLLSTHMGYFEYAQWGTLRTGQGYWELTPVVYTVALVSSTASAVGVGGAGAPAARGG